MKRFSRVLGWSLVLLALGLALRPSWNAVRSVRHGRDYATYHYAIHEAVRGGDPYDTPALGALARAEHTRRAVHPFFYPPPFLLGMVWATPLSLPTAYRVFFWINAATILALFASFRRWFQVPLPVLVVLAAAWGPLPDDLKMGQANLQVLLLATVGLMQVRRRPMAGGALVGAAAMAKMSPALYFAWWAVRRSWKPILGGVAAAVVLSLVSLLLVDLSTQIRFYTKILPAFSTGNYHGLTVPISLPANHSIPDLFNQLWPGPNPHTLSRAARLGSSAVEIGLLAVLCALARQPRDLLGEACLAGAYTVLLVIWPVYTYEHHLSMLILPAAAVATAAMRGRLGVIGWAGTVLAWFFVGWPLSWLRSLQHHLPALSWWLQESKFMGEVLLGMLCVVAARRSPADPTQSPASRLLHFQRALRHPRSFALKS